MSYVSQYFATFHGGHGDNLASWKGFRDHCPSESLPPYYLSGYQAAGPLVYVSLAVSVYK